MFGTWKDNCMMICHKIAYLSPQQCSLRPRARPGADLADSQEASTKGIVPRRDLGCTEGLSPPPQHLSGPSPARGPSTGPPHRWPRLITQDTFRPNIYHDEGIACELFRYYHALISLWPHDAKWPHRYWSRVAQVMACCLTAPPLTEPMSTYHQWNMFRGIRLRSISQQMLSIWISIIWG